MNEVETFARIGERTGAVLGSGVQTARVQATRAGRRLAEQIPQHTARTVHGARKAGNNAQAALAEAVAEYWGPGLSTLADRWGVAQDVLAERLHEARHELAARIEPEPPAHRRRWPWLVTLFLVIAGAVGAVVLTRRPQEIEPDPSHPQLLREPGSRDSDPEATRDPEIAEGTQASNGVVTVERPSASTD